MLLTSPHSRLAFLIFIILIFYHIKTQALVKKTLPEKPRKIRVAIIDTGVDINHQKLKKSIWQNPGEIGFDGVKYDKSTNGADDDGNGFIDDTHGWNFIDNNNNLNDENGHGTHIAGIIQENPNVEIIPIKALDPKLSGEVALRASVRAIEYAIMVKADIINYSAGGYERHPDEEAALRKAQERGIIMVAAAGNNRLNSDRNGFFPAHYPLSNVISVAAVDFQGQLLPTSNFGPQSTTLSAYGKDILSTLPNNQYGKLTGTSQAAAQVTRILAGQMTKSKQPLKTLVQGAKKATHLLGRIKNPVIVSDREKD